MDNKFVLNQNWASKIIFIPLEGRMISLQMYVQILYCSTGSTIQISSMVFDLGSSIVLIFIGYIKSTED